MTASRSILYFNTAAWDHVITPFAEILKARHGIDTVMLTSKPLLPARATFFDRKVFREIVDWRPLLRPRDKAAVPPIADLIRDAGDIEARNGFSVIDVLRADRHLGAGFVTGATGFESTYARGFDFEQALDLAIRLCRETEMLLDRLRPVAIIGMAGTIHTTTLVNIAERRGIPVRFLGAPRRENLFFWCANRWAWPAAFAEDYRRALAGLAKSEEDRVPSSKNHETPERAAQVIRAKAKAPGLIDLLRSYYRILRSSWRQIVGLTSEKDYGSYDPTNRLRIAFYRWNAKRKAARAPHVLPTVDADVPTVFLPLSMEPESSLMVESQGCDTQLTPIDWLAKTLPAGWRLLVKEHPAMELPRPLGFWERIAAYPNVTVLAMTESADQALRRSLAVAMINSTVGLQAAALGKPVICFNPNFIGSVLPHVLQASSYATTAAAIRRVRDRDLPPMTERLRAMEAYRQAYAQSEFPITDPAFLAGIPGKTKADPEMIDSIVRRFFASLERDLRADVA